MYGDDPDANHFNQSYVKDFIDISGNVVLQKDANLNVHKNIITGGNVTIQHTQTHSADLTTNNRIVVDGDISLNANVTVNNNVSMDGNIVRCNLDDSSIPSTAINGVITSGPDFTQSSILYEKGLNMNGDVSFNGTTVQASNLKIDGNIEFSDGTSMDTYESNVHISFNMDALSSNSTTFVHATTYRSTAQGPIRCSEDGKYAIIKFGEDENTNNAFSVGNAGLSAVLLSSDFGETYNVLTLPQSPGYVFEGNNSHLLSYPAVNDFTKVNFICMGISPSGKNIIMGMSGSQQSSNNWHDAAIAFSLDYGTTWTIKYTSSFIYAVNGSFQHSWVGYPAACAIDDTGRIAILIIPKNQYTPIAIRGIYYSSDRTNFAFQDATPGWSQVDIINDDIVWATQTSLSKLTFAGVVRSANVPAINHYSYKYSLSQSMGSAGICAIFTRSWQTGGSTTRPCYFVRDDGTTLTATDMSSTTNAVFADNKYIAMASVMSLSGKYIMIGHSHTGSTGPGENLNLLTAGYSVYYSEDYGATFDFRPLTVPGLVFIKNVVITDNGYIHVHNYHHSRNTHAFKFSGSLAESTFESLTINNTLTAGSFSTSSDYRIKKNIVSLNETNTIDNLRPVKYLHTLLNKEQYGLIAHELQEYYPDLVVGEKDGEDWQRINYTGLIAILINEIKRLKEEVVELENMVH